MRIAVVGNSHMGALKRAHVQGAHPLGQEGKLTFFGAAGRAFTAFEVRDGALHPTSPHALKAAMQASDGLEALTLADYDAILLHGMSLGIGSMDELFADFHGDPELALGEGRKPPARRFLSRAVFARCLEEGLAASIFMRYARAIIEAGYAGRVLISAAPQVNELAPPGGNQKVAREGVGPAELSLILDNARRVAEALGATFLAQPKATLNEDGFTKARFAMSAAQSDNDEDGPEGVHQFGHANRRYGMQVFDLVQKTLAARAPG